MVTQPQRIAQQTNQAPVVAGAGAAPPPAVTDPKLTGPSTPGNLESDWREALKDPKVTTGLLTFAREVLTPPAPGISTFGQIAQAGIAGAGAYGKAGELIRAQEGTERGFGIQEQDLALRERIARQEAETARYATTTGAETARAGFDAALERVRAEMTSREGMNADNIIASAAEQTNELLSRGAIKEGDWKSTMDELVLRLASDADLAANRELGANLRTKMTTMSAEKIAELQAKTQITLQTMEDDTARALAIGRGEVDIEIADIRVRGALQVQKLDNISREFVAGRGLESATNDLILRINSRQLISANAIAADLKKTFDTLTSGAQIASKDRDALMSRMVLELENSQTLAKLGITSDKLIAAMRETGATLRTGMQIDAAAILQEKDLKSQMELLQTQIGATHNLAENAKAMTILGYATSIVVADLSNEALKDPDALTSISERAAEIYNDLRGDNPEIVTPQARANEQNELAGMAYFVELASRAGPQQAYAQGVLDAKKERMGPAAFADLRSRTKAYLAEGGEALTLGGPPPLPDAEGDEAVTTVAPAAPPPPLSAEDSAVRNEILGRLNNAPPWAPKVGQAIGPQSDQYIEFLPEQFDADLDPNIWMAILSHPGLRLAAEKKYSREVVAAKIKSIGGENVKPPFTAEAPLGEDLVTPAAM
jgi:hypothetical protein